MHRRHQWIGPYNDQTLGLHKATKCYYTGLARAYNVTFERCVNIRAETCRRTTASHCPRRCP
jgi:hypothetical protein